MGRKRIGTVEFLDMGYARSHVLYLHFSSLRRLALETISSPFPALENSVLHKRKNCIFRFFVGRVPLSYQNPFFLEH